MRNLVHVTALLLAVSVACGEEEGSGGAGGSSGNAGTAGAAGSPHAALCADACDVIPSCEADADVAACEVQCGQELSGKGYLRLEIAQEYFQLFADLDTDPDCTYSYGVFSWKHWTDFPEKIDALPDQDVMQECKTALNACWGGSFTLDGYRTECFQGYYRYSDEIRSKLQTCFSLPCSPNEPGDCLATNAPKCEPWLAGLKQVAFQCD